ncbi:MAG TPA: hypothetical protein PK629_10440, partial [Oscillospiraceae bacterium]|nr:hypothetical protein [Oscillospiraceae bacterium]HPK36275.1 hypothetical protein [Oscillospiraceae bacterium]
PDAFKFQTKEPGFHRALLCRLLTEKGYKYNIGLHLIKTKCTKKQIILLKFAQNSLYSISKIG